MKYKIKIIGNFISLSDLQSKVNQWLEENQDKRGIKTQIYTGTNYFPDFSSGVGYGVMITYED